MGKVVRIYGNSAFVQVKRTSACGGDCGKCFGCPSTGMTVKLKNDINAKEGDLVRVVSKKSNLMTAVLYVYIIPLIVFVVSYLIIFSGIADTIKNYELAALVGALIILSAYYYGLKFLSKKLTKNEKFELLLQRYQ